MASSERRTDLTSVVAAWLWRRPSLDNDGLSISRIPRNEVKQSLRSDREALSSRIAASEDKETVSIQEFIWLTNHQSTEGEMGGNFGTADG